MVSTRMMTGTEILATDGTQEYYLYAGLNRNDDGTWEYASPIAALLVQCNWAWMNSPNLLPFDFESSKEQYSAYIGLNNEEAKVAQEQ